MAKAVISLGSNIGKREEYLCEANRLIENQIGEIVESSSVHETDSWGFESSRFLNQVIIVSTELLPLELLSKLKEIEIRLGRTEKTGYINDKPKYQDRTIDLDILLYDDLTMVSPELTIPHPHMWERDFILQPLKELKLIP